jgi:hypothetical protein
LGIQPASGAAGIVEVSTSADIHKQPRDQFSTFELAHHSFTNVLHIFYTRRRMNRAKSMKRKLGIEMVPKQLPSRVEES